MLYSACILHVLVSVVLVVLGTSFWDGVWGWEGKITVYSLQKTRLQHYIGPAIWWQTNIVCLSVYVCVLTDWINVWS